MVTAAPKSIDLEAIERAIAEAPADDVSCTVSRSWLRAAMSEIIEGRIAMAQLAQLKRGQRRRICA